MSSDEQTIASLRSLGWFSEHAGRSDAQLLDHLREYPFEPGHPAAMPLDERPVVRAYQLAAHDQYRVWWGHAHTPPETLVALASLLDGAVEVDVVRPLVRDDGADRWLVHTDRDVEVLTVSADDDGLDAVVTALNIWAEPPARALWRASAPGFPPLVVSAHPSEAAALVTQGWPLAID